MLPWLFHPLNLEERIFIRGSLSFCSFSVFVILIVTLVKKESIVNNHDLLNSKIFSFHTILHDSKPQLCILLTNRFLGVFLPQVKYVNT